MPDIQPILSQIGIDLSNPGWLILGGSAIGLIAAPLLLLAAVVGVALFPVWIVWGIAAGASSSSQTDSR